MDTKQNLISLLRAFTISKSTFQGKLVHQKILTLGLQSNSTFCKYLINFYFACHWHHSATLVFRTIENPSELSLWNGLLGSYTKNYMFIEALELFQKLLLFPCVNADEFTYPSVLKACGELGWLGYGKTVHCHLVKTGFLSDVFVSSSLVALYSKCNVFGCAEKVFDEIPERDVSCWNAMVSCCYRLGRPEKAVELFEEMRRVGFEANSVTLMVVISSCARLLDLERGREIHREAMRSGLLSRGFVRDSLVDMYGKCGCVEMAREVFEGIPRKNVIAWNSVIAAYSLKGDAESCIELFTRMRDEKVRPTLTTFSIILLACIRSVQLRHGKFIHGYIVRNGMEPDIYINTLLTDLYFKCGIVSSAKNVFEKIPAGNVVYSNIMISGYVAAGQYFEALGSYDSMKEIGISPDAITFTSVLPACSQLAALEKGKEIHKSIKESEFANDKVVMGALLDMYAKCGALDGAIEVFHRLPERDVISWSSMIAAYGSHGRALEALNLFHELQNSNEKPDGIAFLAVLSACSHGGLVDEGLYYFNQMITEYRIKPNIEHYSCLLDLLGRAGRLNEAYEILQNSTEIQDEVDLLSTLLSACRLHKDVSLGVKVAKLIIEKNPNDPSTYVTLSNIYAYDKNWHEFRKVRLKMKELGLRKSPGYSWIEIDKRTETFFCEDKSHSQTEMIYHCLKFLASHMDKNDLCRNLLLANGPQNVIFFEH